MLEIRLIIEFCLSSTTGPRELVVQTDETRFVTDCKVDPAALVGHVQMTLAPEEVIIGF